MTQTCYLLDKSLHIENRAYMKDLVLLEATGRFATSARQLLKAAQFEPVTEVPSYRAGCKILYQLPLSVYRGSTPLSVGQTLRRIQQEAVEARKRHANAHIIFCAPEMSEERYVQILSELVKRPKLSPLRNLALTIRASAAVARFLEAQPSAPKETFVLDQLPGIDVLGDDLRDDATGKLDAHKISDLFKIPISRIAGAVGITRQALDETPTSEKAQPLLRLFERIARLRALPQLTGDNPSSLRKWFQKSLPLFSGHSADELFREGKLDVVAEKVDQLLTGDFGG